MNTVCMICSASKIIRMSISRYCELRIWGIILISMFVSYNNMLASDFEVGGIHYNIESIENYTCVVVNPKPVFEFGASNIVRIDGSSELVYLPPGGSYSGHIVIPSTVEFKGRKLSVVGIDDGAFYKCNGLFSVAIPSTVKRIGNYAFYLCENLSVVSGDIKASIEYAAFYGCKSLNSVTIKGASYISHKAFYGCERLEELTIPSTVSMIGAQAFRGCQNLSKVIFDNSPYGIIIGFGAFMDTFIKNLYVGRDLEYRNYPTILDGYKRKEPYEKTPFLSLEHIVIGDYMTSIKNGDILDVADVKTIVFGESVNQITALKNTENLEYIICKSHNPPSVKENFSMYIILNIPLYVPSGSVQLYKNAYPWKEFIIKEISR